MQEQEEEEDGRVNKLIAMILAQELRADLRWKCLRFSKNLDLVRTNPIAIACGSESNKTKIYNLVSPLGLD